MNAALLAWRVAGTLAEPGAVLLLRRRLARGKEIAARLAERRGVASETRPAGRLLWVHAASVGEALSVLPVLKALSVLQALADAPARPDTVLLTTGTRTATELLERRLGEDGLTPFVRLAMAPLDVPRWVGGFLDHWRPDAAAFVESELWPNMLGEARRRGVRLALLNARMSARSAARWQRLPGAARALFGHFEAIWVRSDEDAVRLAALGAPPFVAKGDLKEAASPLPCDEGARSVLAAAIGGRPVWLAASTHAGEEEIVRDAHLQLLDHFPDALAIVAPRHPGRGAAVAALLNAAPRRARGERPRQDHAFYVADTVGELGLLYRLASVVFIGRSLGGDGGGQNPLEPARFGCAVAMGPGRANVAGLASRLEKTDALGTVRDAESLAAFVGMMLADPDMLAATGARARQAATSSADLAAAAAWLLARLAAP